MMKYEVPFYRKCVKHFFNQEEAEAFIIQCYFDGNKHINTIYDEGYTRIENPNPNIIADMTVKSVEIDWVSQFAKISVVTR